MVWMLTKYRKLLSWQPRVGLHVPWAAPLPNYKHWKRLQYGWYCENLYDTSSYRSWSFFFLINIFLQVIFNALFAPGFYLVQSVQTDIRWRLSLQSVGTSFINKLPLHSIHLPTHPFPHLTQLLAGINFTSPFMALLSMDPLSHQYAKELRAPSGALSARICDQGELPAWQWQERESFPLHGALRSSVSVTPLCGLVNLLLALRLSSFSPPPQSLLLVMRLEHLLMPTSVSRSPLLPLVTEVEPSTGSLQTQRKRRHVRTSQGNPVSCNKLLQLN